MRRSLGVLVVTVLLACTACTTGSASGGDDVPRPSASASVSAEPETSFSSTGIDWPAARGELSPGAAPAPPDGFDAALLDRMAGLLTGWAQVAALDEDVRRSTTPIDKVAAVLPEPVGAALRDQTQAAVSPALAVANVFAEDVTVVGDPRVTTAWRQSTEVDDAGRGYVLLELQTRTAYEVRVGGDGPTRVVGVLRVHGLSAYPDTTEDFGISGGWQEFGATDCALALDDDLVPDADLGASAIDLQTFVTVGDGPRVEMPSLGEEQQVDAEYLRRCRAGAT
ncbi:MAG: hypothetical protein JWR55_2428 [Aeromicrobium sp.]|jgi:hypothetical protein|nr:hypothetical protein [Aeromicrobium sp.]